MKRRSISSITAATIDKLGVGGQLIDHFRDGTSLRVARYKSGIARPEGSLWFRVAVFDAAGKCVEKYDSREAVNAHRRVVTVTRKHGGPQ